MDSEISKSTNKRIAKNTIILYFRMILLMLISLYTSRVILQALGESDYGIYNVVGGFVSMFSLISNTLSASISRFLTFELGAGNKEKLQKTFSASIFVQLLMVLILVLFVEIFGVWFLNTKMNLPSERMFAANWILQFSMVAFALNLISLPYNALIVAHEKMSAFAYVSILEAALKLAICFIIAHTTFDKLILYSALLVCVAIVIRFIYASYCKRKFDEAKFTFNFNKELCYKLFSFSGWNFIGASAGVLRSQGVNVLLNLFFGPTVNAARGISMQVSSLASAVYNNFLMALNPNITKSFAAGEKEQSFKFVIQGSRFTEYLIFIVSLPIILETPTLMNIWLVKVPDYTVIFVRLILIYMMSESISNTLITLMLATGKIRDYQILVGGCQLLNLPISYVILKLGGQPYYTVLVSIFIALVCLFLRLYMLKRMIAFPMGKFLIIIFRKVFLVFLVALIIPTITVFTLPQGFVRLFITFGICIITVPSIVYILACDSSERALVKKTVKSFKTKLYARRS